MLPHLAPKVYDPVKFAADIAAFNCCRRKGQERGEDWEEYLNDWIKGEEPSHDINKRQNDVYLYYSKSRLVGYGSLGTTRLADPRVPGSNGKCSVIPTFAVSIDFQKEPRGCERYDRFSHRILSDLLLRSLLHGTTLMTLFVHQKNDNARGFYQKAGFAMVGPSSQDEHDLMVYELTALRERLQPKSEGKGNQEQSLDFAI